MLNAILPRRLISCPTASQASKPSGAVTHLRPSASEIYALPIPFYGNYFPQNLLFFHCFFGAAGFFATSEKRRRFAVPVPNPHHAMGD